MNKKAMIKAGLVGAVNAIAGTYYFGAGNVDAFGMSVPVWAPLLASGAVSSAVADTLHEKVLDYLPNNENYAEIESMLVGGALAGVANLGVLSLSLGPLPSRNYIPAVAIGAGSYVAGDYLNNKLYSGVDNQFIF